MAKRENEGLPMGDVLKEFIKTNRLENGIDQVQVKEAWAKLMGNGVNNYTREVTLRNDVLYVNLTSSVLRQELLFGKEKIIKLLNEELGKDLIKKVVLR